MVVLLAFFIRISGDQNTGQLRITFTVQITCFCLGAEPEFLGLSHTRFNTAKLLLLDIVL
jgi:hypothetical protein